MKKTAQDYLAQAMEHHRAKRWEKALKGYDLALAIEPLNYVALGNRAELFHRYGRMDEAHRDYQIALSAHPECADGWHNYGNLLWYLGHLETALECMNNAITLAPTEAIFWHGKANVLREMARDKEALEACERALRLRPDFKEAKGNRSWLNLRLGNWPMGWSDFEFRGIIEPELCLNLPQKRWDGKAKDRPIVLMAEQGLGDVIMCARFAPYLKEQGYDVILFVWPKMAALLRSTGCRVVDDIKELPHSYYWAPIMSYAGLLGATPRSIPGKVPYLFAEQERVERWADKMAFHCSPRPYIGIIWSPGHKMHHGYTARDIPLELFEPFAKLGTVFSLQKPEPAELPSWIRTLLGRDTNPKENFFLDTAACMMNMDLIISTDTSTAHLAGALGKRTFLPLPTGTCWRWLLDRSDTPWYPTMTIFRQKTYRDWSPVFEGMLANV